MYAENTSRSPKTRFSKTGEPANRSVGGSFIDLRTMYACRVTSSSVARQPRHRMNGRVLSRVRWTCVRHALGQQSGPARLSGLPVATLQRTQHSDYVFMIKQILIVSTDIGQRFFCPLERFFGVLACGSGQRLVFQTRCVSI